MKETLFPSKFLSAQSRRGCLPIAACVPVRCGKRWMRVRVRRVRELLERALTGGGDGRFLALGEFFLVPGFRLPGRETRGSFCSLVGGSDVPLYLRRPVRHPLSSSPLLFSHSNVIYTPCHHNH